MTILHIFKSLNRQFAGTDVVIPNHIKAQQSIEFVGCINIANINIDGVKNQFNYEEEFKLKSIPEPFNKPDIVVFHQIYVPEYIKISKALRKEKIPYIIVPHGSLTKEAQKKKKLKKLLGNLFFNPFIKNAKAIQCLSKMEEDTTKWNVPKFIGTNGYNLPQNQKRSFHTEKIRFTYIGRLDWFHKGLDILLDAFKLLMDSPYKDKCELCIYGPDYQGRYAHVEQMIAERSLGSMVKLSPAVFGEEKERILLDSDIFIQTSRFEGMPMGILEAAGYGLPCLITEGTTLGELVEKSNAGWVAKTNAESVLKQLKVAIDDSATWLKKSENARKMIEDNFAWEKIAENTIKYYLSIIKHRGC